MENENLTPEEQAVELSEAVAAAPAELVEETVAEPVEEAAEQPVPAAQTNFWDADAPDYEPEPPVVVNGKPLYKKWWFWAIIAGVIAIAAVVAVILSDGSTGGSGGGGGSSYGTTYVSPYVTVVKTAKNSKYGITYGAAFDRFFTNPKWSYFKATSGEHVVEFTGGFLYSGERATAKVQFIVDMAEGTLEVYHLSINGVAQSRLMLATLVQKVFESY